MIVSPCISICKTDPTTGFCYGCGRDNNEKKMWKLNDTSEDWKSNNLKIIKSRLTGWQLESFNESYKYKICLLYTSPSPRDATLSRMPSSA